MSVYTICACKVKESGMCRFFVFLAITCCATLDVCAVEHEGQAEVAVRVKSVVNGSDVIRNVTWDITDMQSAEGKPLWKELVALENEQKFRNPFSSRVLDGAMCALIKDVKSYDVKEKPKKCGAFKQSMEHLSQEGRWFWFIDNTNDSRTLVPGAVRLSLERIPGVPERGQSPVIEGFSVQNGGYLLPYWWQDSMH